MAMLMVAMRGGLERLQRPLEAVVAEGLEEEI